MVRASDDYHRLPGRAVLRNNAVDFLHKGTGGIHHSHIPLLQDLINMPADAVGADDDRSLVSWKGPQLILCLQDHDPLIRQIPDHFLIVDNGTVGVDGAGCLFVLQGFYLFIDLVHCPFHAKAEAGALCNCNFPVHGYPSYPRSLAMRMMESTTCSMVMWEESRSTASSACLKGEFSRCMSR